MALKIWFGQYKGCTIAETPDYYLVWMLEKVKDLSPVLRQAIEKHLEVESPKSFSCDVPLDYLFGRIQTKMAEVFIGNCAWLREQLSEVLDDLRDEVRNLHADNKPVGLSTLVRAVDEGMV